MGILIGIVVGLVSIGVVAVLLFRRERAGRAEADAALDELAATLSGERLRDRITGNHHGRSCAISELGTYGSEGTHRYLHIAMALQTDTTLELHPQTSALGARLVNDVEIGDAEFDKWFIVRTNDPARVAGALAPELRRQLVDWLKAGWFARAWIKDGQLHLEGGRGIRRPADVARLRTMLGALERVAVALE